MVAEFLTKPLLKQQVCHKSCLLKQRDAHVVKYSCINVVAVRIILQCISLFVQLEGDQVYGI